MRFKAFLDWLLADPAAVLWVPASAPRGTCELVRPDHRLVRSTKIVPARIDRHPNDLCGVWDDQGRAVHFYLFDRAVLYARVSRPRGRVSWCFAARREGNGISFRVP